MGLFTNILKIGAMMDWASPVVNGVRKANGDGMIEFSDAEFKVADRIIRRHGGRGIDVTHELDWYQMVPRKNYDACIADLRKNGIDV